MGRMAPTVNSVTPLDRLRSVVREAGDALVVFSGGVDSALVLKVAVEELGDRAVALTADSPTFPPEERRDAEEFARAIGARHMVVDAHELEREGYRANAGDRCYHCKSELFDLAELWADRLGLRWVMDGTIVDDLGDDRPGLRAAAEHRVRHPLLEAEFTKADVRDAARQLDVPLWDKPAFACLGSRFPVGTEVTLEWVEKISRVESVLRIYGFRTFRVRIHKLDGGAIARIELGEGEMQEIFREGIREAVVAAALQEGFSRVTLDLAGYRLGGGAI